MTPNLFTIAGHPAENLSEKADALRKEIAADPSLQLAKELLSQQDPDVLEALVVVRGHEDPHIHPKATLIVVVLEGGGYVQLDASERIETPAGSVAVIPKGVCHAFHNQAPNDSVLFATFSPANSDSAPCPS